VSQSDLLMELRGASRSSRPEFSWLLKDVHLVTRAYRAGWHSGTTRIRQVFGSKLGRNTGYSDFGWFSHSLQTNSRIVPPPGHTATSFQIIIIFSSDAT
jgi:hypothetical protein